MKTVRNNLFHGGKYPYDPIRDVELLQSCLAVLMSWAEFIPEIHGGFDQIIQSYFANENEVFQYLQFSCATSQPAADTRTLPVVVVIRVKNTKVTKVNTALLNFLLYLYYA